MKKPIRKSHGWLIANLVVVLALLLTGVLLGPKFSYQDVEPLISALENMSAMVFTIMGIWIAFIYPNAILRITQPSKIDAIFSEEDEKRINMLVGTIIVSALVLVFLLLSTLLKLFLSKSGLYLHFPSLVKITGVSFLLLLSYVQLVCVYIVIASNVNFLIDLRSKRNLHEMNRRL
ncbi:MAG TPA: hypothetical protein VL943_09555 [Niabella sp.]|nr:hypothetical protein [Niabella sp.]